MGSYVLAEVMVVASDIDDEERSREGPDPNNEMGAGLGASTGFSGVGVGLTVGALPSGFFLLNALVGKMGFFPAFRGMKTVDGVVDIVVAGPEDTPSSELSFFSESPTPVSCGSASITNPSNSSSFAAPPPKTRFRTALFGSGGGGGAFAPDRFGAGSIAASPIPPPPTRCRFDLGPSSSVAAFGMLTTIFFFSAPVLVVVDTTFGLGRPRLAESLGFAATGAGAGASESESEP